MFYNVLGRITWFAAKRYVRKRLDAKPIVAGAVLTTALAAALIALRHGSNGRGG